jgi:hypothetical protein
MKEYRVWRAMKARCYAPSQNRGYYKAEHIKVCERWKHSFDNFINDMGYMPSDKYSIERIDVHQDYCPENCKWILQTEQSKNRRNSIMITANGKTMCLKDWARYLDIKYTTLYKRYKAGNIAINKEILL